MFECSLPFTIGMLAIFISWRLKAFGRKKRSGISMPLHLRKTSQSGGNRLSQYRGKIPAIAFREIWIAGYLLDLPFSLVHLQGPPLLLLLLLSLYRSCTQKTIYYTRNRLYASSFDFLVFVAFMTDLPRSDKMMWNHEGGADENVAC